MTMGAEVDLLLAYCVFVGLQMCTVREALVRAFDGRATDFPFGLKRAIGWADFPHPSFDIEKPCELSSPLLSQPP